MPAFGFRHSEESKRKISERTKQALAEPEHYKNLVESHIGFVMKEETKSKISKNNGRGMQGKKHSEEAKQKLKIIQKEVHSRSEWKLKQSESHKKIPKEEHSCFGKQKPEITRKRIAETLKIVYQIKENHPRWLGGLSFEPYPISFNNCFKERVRLFFNYHCLICGKPQRDEKLSIHHYDYDKKSKNVVPLHRDCHTMTNTNREYWELYFSELIAIQYGGKCYFTEEEILTGGRALCCA